jgi:hypothetical protein
MTNGPGIDGANTEVSAAQRLADYKHDSRYPVNSRPARDDTPSDVRDWPGLPEAKSAGAVIEGYADEKLHAGSLYLDVKVAVREAGRYSFFAVLREAENDQALAVSTVTRDMAAGPTRVTFEFYGLILREAAGESAAARSYRIAGVGGERIPDDQELQELIAGERQVSPEGRLAPLLKSYTTATYDPGRFTDKIWDAPEKRKRIAELEAEVRAEAEAEAEAAADGEDAPE